MNSQTPTSSESYIVRTISDYDPFNEDVRGLTFCEHSLLVWGDDHDRDVDDLPIASTVETVVVDPALDTTIDTFEQRSDTMTAMLQRRTGARRLGGRILIIP